MASDPSPTARPAPLRWRKKRADKTRFSPDAYVLARGSDVVATVQQMTGGKWFWYGGKMNTAADPKGLDECKFEAAMHAKRMETAENAQS